LPEKFQVFLDVLPNPGITLWQSKMHIGRINVQYILFFRISSCELARKSEENAEKNGQNVFPLPIFDLSLHNLLGSEIFHQSSVPGWSESKIFPMIP
jgi:hypothetical protein